MARSSLPSPVRMHVRSSDRSIDRLFNQSASRSVRESVSQSVSVMIHGEDVRCVGEICLRTGLLRAGVVNEVIIWERYVRRA